MFFENQDALEEASDEASTQAANVPPTPDSPLPARDGANIDPALISEGVRILQQIPTKETCEEMLASYRNVDGDLICTLISNSFWHNFGQSLSSEQGMESLASLMCRNATTAMQDSDDAQTWIASCTGQNMRWEGTPAPKWHNE